MVGDDAVDLFGHLAVEGAQAGFDMGHRDVQLAGGQGAGEGGIGVAVNHQPVRLGFEEDFFDRFQHASGLGAMAAGADAEVVGGLGIQFLEENVGHVLVVMLAGVDEDFLTAGRLPKPA